MNTNIQKFIVFLITVSTTNGDVEHVLIVVVIFNS